MTLTIQLPAEVEIRLRDRAAEIGIDPDAYARKLIEQGLNGGRPVPPPGTTLDQILAPFRREVEEGGATDDELRDLFTGARDEARAEKRAQGKIPR